MNKIRKSHLKAVMEGLEELLSQLEELKDEEEECLDNVPENLQGTERYQNSELALGYMEEAVDSIENAISCITSVVE